MGGGFPQQMGMPLGMMPPMYPPFYPMMMPNNMQQPNVPPGFSQPN